MRAATADRALECRAHLIEYAPHCVVVSDSLSRLKYRDGFAANKGEHL